MLIFGLVSLLMDFVYEGARSITGPLLAGLGASAAQVGVVTGAGEAAALGLRLVSGPLADRTRRFWAWTIAGYALTAVTVPLLGLTGVLWAAGALVIAERVGKAVRSPAKDTLLSHATAATGRGRGFAVHEAMDQVGALIGPLIVAGMLAAHRRLRPGAGRAGRTRPGRPGGPGLAACPGARPGRLRGDNRRRAARDQPRPGRRRAGCRGRSGCTRFSRPLP